MNPQTINGTIRIIVPAITAPLLAWAISRGYLVTGAEPIVNEALIGLVTAVVTFGSIVLTVVAHKNSNLIKDAASVDPKVQVAVPDHLIADDPAIKKVVDDNVKYPNVVPLKKAA
jgi:hypothetical protein